MRLSRLNAVLGLIVAPLLALSGPAHAISSQEQAQSVGANCPGSVQTPVAGFVYLVADTTGRLCVSLTLPASSTVIGKVGIDQTTPGVTNGVQITGAPTTTLTQVASSASAVTVLAANASRRGATIVNDSAAVLYLVLSATTPTSSVYTVALDTKGSVGAYYEVPFGYTGIIKGIWAAANGNAVVTEFQ